MTRTVSRDLTCPTDAGGCGAPAGHPCTGKDNRPLRSVHPVRTAAARALQAERDAIQAEAQARAIPGDVAAGTSNVGITVDSAGTATPPRPTAVPPAEEYPDETPDAELTDREVVTRLLVLRVLEDKVAALKGDLREQGAALLRVGDNMAGYLDGDDRALGRVGLSKARESWKVEDPDTVLRWCQTHAPDEVEVRPVVRASFLAALMKSCKDNKGHWLNPATGELVEVDGVFLDQGSPTLTVKASEEAEQIVAAAIAAGRLALDGHTTLALPAVGAA